MSNIRKDLNLNGTFTQKVDALKSVKLAGAGALEKDILAAPTVEIPNVVNPTVVTGVPPVQPMNFNPTTGVIPPVNEPVAVPEVAPQAVEPMNQPMEPVGQQTVVTPPSLPEMPGTKPEVYNPIPNNLGGAQVLDDAQQKIETPMEFSQKPVPSLDNIVQFPGTTAETPVLENYVAGENMYNMPYSPADAKVEPLPGTTNEDKLKELKAKLLENIENLIEEYVKSVQELTGDKKVIDSAMTGLDQVQETVNQGSQVLTGQSYQPIDMTQEQNIEGITRAA